MAAVAEPAEPAEVAEPGGPGGSSPRLPEGVGATGYNVACWRAEESARADRLFDDPLAAVFASRGPGLTSMLDVSQHTETEIVDLIAFGAITQYAFAVRTRFFDDFLLAAATACAQVVLLAAGLDARAFRLPWPDGTHLFEVDLPAVLDFKADVLSTAGAASTCARTAVAADLAGDWSSALLDAGLDPDVPTAWLAEGLMLYLSSEEAEALLSRIGQLSPAGSRLSFEHGPYADDELLDRVVTTRAMRPAVATWKGGLRIPPGTWLDARGWASTTDSLAGIGSGLGREAPPHTAVDLVVATRVAR